MTRKEVTILIPSGLEARPIALLVQAASQFSSDIHLECQNKTVNAKSIMGMMTMGLSSGETVVVTADGADEEAAILKIEEYLSGKK